MSAAIDALLDNAVSSGKFLGLSFIAVDKDGTTLYSGARGHRNWARTDSMAISTPAWLASMSKLMTSLAAMHVVERGLVGLDDDAAQILGEIGGKDILISFDNETKTGQFRVPVEKVTLRRLLSHSSGFAYGGFVPRLEAWAVSHNKTSRNRSGDFHKDWDGPLIAEPGTQWNYSTGIDWAGKIVEKVSGMTLEEYMQKYIWTPLQMKNTTFHPERRHAFDLLEPGLRNKDDNRLYATEPIYPTSCINEAGGAGVFSSAEDYVKILVELLQGNGVVLSSSNLEEFLKPQLSASSVASLKESRAAWVLEEIPQEIPVDHCLGGLVTCADITGRRAKGSIQWDGLSRPKWLVDRASGIALVFVTQILEGDPFVTTLWTELEKEAYKLLGGKK